MLQYSCTTSAGHTMSIRVDTGLLASMQSISSVRDRYIRQSSLSVAGRVANLPADGGATADACEAQSTRAARPISRTIRRFFGSLT